jgi:hypothetical protein
MCICSLYSENKFENVKNLEKENKHLYLYILRAHAKFREERIFFMASTKRQKTCHEKAYFSTKLYHFYIDHINSRFF